MVTMIDLIGVKSLAPSRKGSKAMQKLHATAHRLAQSGFRATDHVYAFNDSIFMLTYLDTPSPGRLGFALHDAEDLKDATADIAPSYGVVVRRKTLPEAMRYPDSASVITTIRASSWALANCFTIEQDLKHLRMAWYVDGRVVRDVPTLKRFNDGKHLVKLLPRGKKRNVFVFRDELFGGAVPAEPSDGISIVKPG